MSHRLQAPGQGKLALPPESHSSTGLTPQLESNSAFLSLSVLQLAEGAPPALGRGEPSLCIYMLIRYGDARLKNTHWIVSDHMPGNPKVQLTMRKLSLREADASVQGLGSESACWPHPGAKGRATTYFIISLQYSKRMSEK